MRQRRRAERDHFAARAPSQQRSTRRETERAQRRLLLIGVAALALLLVGVLAVGWYVGSFQPPRRVIAEVNGEPVRVRDLVAYTRLEGFPTGFYSTATVATARNSYIRDRILRLRASTLGVTVTAADVEESIAIRFEPPPGPEEPRAVVLSEEGRELLAGFLDNENLDVREADYRSWIEGGLLVGAVSDHFAAELPEAVEQVFVHWIIASDSVNAQAAFDRVEAGEEFASVAADLNVELALAGETGEVGWVPRGAFPEFDILLFDPDLELGGAIGPLVTTVGSIVIRVTDGPSEQPLEDEMRVLVSQSSLQEWMDGQTDELVDVSDLSIDDALWVLDRVIGR